MSLNKTHNRINIELKLREHHSIIERKESIDNFVGFKHDELPRYVIFLYSEQYFK